jgi:hypothetical protein
MIFEAKLKYLLKRSLFYGYLDNNQTCEILIDDLNDSFIVFLKSKMTFIIKYFDIL